MRHCAFCPNTSLTREHIWSDWICQRIGPNGISRSIGMADGSVKQIQEPILAAKAKVVCGQCNGGWMSTLEAQAKPILEPMIFRGTPVDLGRLETGIVAPWAFKSAVIGDASKGRSTPPFFTFAERQTFAATLAIPQAVRIFIGQRVSANGKAEFKSYTTTTPTGFTPAFSWYTLVYTVGQLLLRVDAVRNENGDPIINDAAQAAHAINQLSDALPCIWPQAGVVHWPPRFCFDDDAMDTFLDNMKIVKNAAASRN